MTSYDLGGIYRPTVNSVLRKAVVNWFFQCDCLYHALKAKAPRRTMFGMMLHGFGIVYPKLRPWIHRKCDLYFHGNRVVTGQLEKHSTYIVAACLARKL